MTAVASPQSFPSLPRLSWSSGNSSQGGLNTEDVSRMFMHRKTMSRSNSSSSVSSIGSSSTVVSMTSKSNENVALNGEPTYSFKKKSIRGIWPSSKADVIPGIGNGRMQTSTSTSSSSTSATLSAIHQAPSVLPSPNIKLPQQNGKRTNGQAQNDLQPTLVLLPVNNTFERKHITVPVFPEVMKIGRQTNPKTVPSPVNGYFDSKVLSRQHAELWADRSGKIWIRDVKSSNGTFVNGKRLSPENKDSDPCELHEGDVLELGIDIVSEDQKTIVHHKVSAKVDRAGMYSGGLSMVDLNIASANTSSVGSNRYAPSGMANGIQQRQMNVWFAPLSIEQVIKKLNVEMKQAKQELLDLDRTEASFAVGKAVASEHDKVKSRLFESQSMRETNGSVAAKKMDHNANFTGPPVPPPQLPLPETPDSARNSPSDLLPQNPHSLFKRRDSDKLKHSRNMSPNKSESPSQILALVEALQVARKEIDSQSIRVKQLESLLSQERAARETAEQKLRAVEVEQTPQINAQTSRRVTSESIVGEGIPASEKLDLVNHTGPAETDDGNVKAQHTASLLQQRINLMVTEMDDMKMQMERYRHRAEVAEEESLSTRNSLTEMVEKIRQENTRRESAESLRIYKSSDAGTTTYLEQGSLVCPKLFKFHFQNGNTDTTEPITQLEEILSFTLNNRPSPSERLAQAVPLASMLGVVLLGVGIMTYINNWQKVDR